MSYYAWTEYDQEGDDGRVWALLKEKDVHPTLVVTTGFVPWPRRHLYFRLKEADHQALLRWIRSTRHWATSWAQTRCLMHAALCALRARLTIRKQIGPERD